MVLALVAAAGCDRDTVDLVVPPTLTVVFGMVRDEAGEIPAQFSAVFESTANASCNGPALASTAVTGTTGRYRLLVSRVPQAACHRLVITAPSASTVPDTVRGLQPPFDAPDSLRVDVVLERRDVQTLRLRAALGPAYGLPVAISVPDTVARNQPFTVSSRHHGSTSCTTLDTVEVVQAAGQATLSPYVWQRVGGGCTADIRFFTQTAQLTLTQAGPATIHFVGRDTTVTRTTFVR